MTTGCTPCRSGGLAERYWTSVEQFAVRSATATIDEGSKLEDRMSTERISLISQVERFQRLQHRNLIVGAENMSRTRDHLLAGTLGLGVLMLLVGGFSSWLTARSVQRPVAKLVEATRALAQGDFESALGLQCPREKLPLSSKPTNGDELTELACAFGRTATALLAREQSLLADARLGSAVAGSLDPESVAREVLGTIIEHTGCEVGAVYLLQPGSMVLRRIASHALEAADDTVALGEGIPGEAARSGRTLLVTDLPQDAPFQVRLGIDRLPPKAVLAVPMMFHGHCLGVLLLASLRPVSNEMRSFVEHAAAEFGLGLRNAVAHLELSRLANELEERNQRLGVQAKKIQVQNEELQAQSEEIQVQNEEIRAQNDQLRQMTIDIRRQNQELQTANQRLARSGGSARLLSYEDKRSAALGQTGDRLRAARIPGRSR